MTSPGGVALYSSADTAQDGLPRWFAPAAIGVLAIVVRLIVILVDGGYFPAHDAFDYSRHAVSIAGGEGFPESRYALDGGPSALRPPVYPYILGVVFQLSGNSVFAGRVAGAVLGGIAVLLLIVVVNQIWGRRTALVAGGMAAVFPPLVLLDVQLLSEPVFVVLELGALACALFYRRADDGRLRWAIAAGALCGLAALTRNPGILIAIPIALGFWIRGSGSTRRRWAGLAVVIICAAMMVFPWTIRNAVDFGRFVPLTASNGFAMAGTYNLTSYDDDANPAAWRSPVLVPEFSSLFLTHGVDEATIDANLRRRALTFAREHPAYVAEAVWWNSLRILEIKGGSVIGRDGTPVEQRGIGSGRSLAEQLSLALAGLLALCGVIAIRRSRGAGHVGESLAGGPWFMWFLPLLTLLVALPFAGLPRYRVPADPFLLMLAAVGLLAIWDRARAAERIKVRS